MSMPDPPKAESVNLLALLPREETERGRFLRILREVRGYRQTAVERELPMSHSDLSRIERGSSAADETILRLLRHYQASRIEVLLIGLLLGHRNLPERITELIAHECEIKA
jgi:transcriptional regulator with XRE-family HTH domain